VSEPLAVRAQSTGASIGLIEQLAVARIVDRDPDAIAGDVGPGHGEAIARGVNGQLERLPPGFVASPAVIGAKQDQILLTITAPADARSAIVSPTITGSATVDGQPVTRTATPAEAVTQAFSYTHHVPTKELLLAVIEFDTFTLEQKDPAKLIELKPDSTAEITVAVRRKPGVEGAIAFKPAAVTPGLNVRSASIPADNNEAKLTLVATKQAQPGSRYDIVLTGSLKIGKETISRSLPAIPVVITTASQTSPPTNEQCNARMFLHLWSLDGEIGVSRIARGACGMIALRRFCA
jgi:hypothetical protein